MMPQRAINRVEDGDDGALNVEQLSAIGRVLIDAGIEFRRNRLPVLKKQAADPPTSVRLWVCAVATKSLLHQELLPFMLVA
jgi:hypothetical protein